jgi:hypothetical protein
MHQRVARSLILAGLICFLYAAESGCGMLVIGMVVIGVLVLAAGLWLIVR